MRRHDENQPEERNELVASARRMLEHHPHAVEPRTCSTAGSPPPGALSGDPLNLSILQLWWIERIDDAEALQWSDRSKARIGGHKEQFIPEALRRSDRACQLDRVQAPQGIWLYLPLSRAEA